MLSFSFSLFCGWTRLVALLLLSSLLTLSATAQYGQTQKLNPSPRAAGDRAGNAVALSGSVMVVGSVGNSTDANDQNVEQSAGAAFVFEKIDGVWVQTAKLVAADRAGGPGADSYDFGAAVAVSGGTIVVGSPHNYTDANLQNSKNQAGAAYVFEKVANVWTQKQKIVAADRDNADSFGKSVAIAGNALVVGSNSDTDADNQNDFFVAGAVYLFEKQANVWNQTQKIVASDRYEGGVFGSHLAFNGSTLAVGNDLNDFDANGENELAEAGAVYVFEKNGNGFVQKVKLLAADRTEKAEFGNDVALSGNTLVVGNYLNSTDANGQQSLSAAGAVYVFRKNGNTWSQSQKLVAADRAEAGVFGVSVALDGSTLVVGSSLNDTDSYGEFPVNGAGAAYVFKEAGNSFTQNVKINAADRSGADQFGQAVAVGGTTVVVGSPRNDIDGNTFEEDAGAAYVFEPCTPALENVYADILIPTCAGQDVTVELGLSTCFFPTGNVFSAELSDKNGNFPGTPLGALAGLFNNHFQIPANAQTGNYKIRVTSTNPVLSATSSSFLVTAVELALPPTVAANTSLCAGQKLSVGFTPPATCAPEGITAQLSNASGTFDNPVSLGPVVAGNNLLPIPAGTPAGAGYRIRFKSETPSLVSPVSVPFMVKPLTFPANPTVSQTPACAGASVKVSFTIGNTCPFPDGNTFSAQLSDASGSFAAPQNLGPVTAGLNPVGIPQTTPTGGGYRIRIVASADPNALISNSSGAFTINQPSFAAIPTVSNTNKCPGETVKLSFSTACTFFPGNTFKAELSDAAGNFGAPIDLGNVSVGLSNVLIPANLLSGSNYKIRVVSSNPVLTSAASAGFKVKNCGNGREIAPEEMGLQVTVSPNPATDGRLRIQISGAEGQRLNVDLFNGTGLPLRQQTLERAGETDVLDWDIAVQPAGLYLLRVSGAKDVKTVKVLR